MNLSERKRLPRNGRFALLCGLSLGLALITKSTMYILAAPFCAGLVAVLLWKSRLRAIGQLIVIALLAFSINVPTYCRNQRFTHAWLGNGGFGTLAGQYNVKHPSLGTTTSNIVRNLSLEIAVDLPGVIPTVENTVRNAHHILGLNPDDPATILPAVKNYDLVHNLVWNSEDTAPNPFHVLLIFAALLTILFRWRRGGGAAIWYGLAVLSGFVVFCAYLRYQPWHCRLLLPVLIAFSAFVGVILEREWKPIVSLAVCGLLPLLVSPWILLNDAHPLVGANSIFIAPRENRYFVKRNLLVQYQLITNFAESHQVKQVAVIGDGNCWEYPLQVMLRARIPNLRIEAYPGIYTMPAAVLHTRNTGFDENDKPYLVVKLTGENADMVELVKK